MVERTDDEKVARAAILDIEGELSAVLDRMTAPHAAGGHPAFALFLGVSALGDLLCRSMTQYVADFPDQRGRCIALVGVLARAVAPPSQQHLH